MEIENNKKVPLLTIDSGLSIIRLSTILIKGSTHHNAYMILK